MTEEEIIAFAKQYDPQPGPETFILGIGATGTVMSRLPIGKGMLIMRSSKQFSEDF